MQAVDGVMGRRAIASQLTAFLCWLGVTASGLYLTPDRSGHGTHTQLGLPPCPSALLFDRPCPGCGLTTSVSATIHGDLALAWASHPFGPVAYLLFTVYALVAFGKWLKGRELRLHPRFNAALVWSVSLFVLFGATRALLSPAYTSEPELRFVQRLKG